MAKGTILSIKRHIRAGWRYVEGKLEKGRIRGARPGFIPPVPLPGDPRYNPAKDAPALRLHPGAEFVGPNRYRAGQHLVDQWGSFRDPDECEVCGSIPGAVYRMVLVEQRPAVPPWRQVWTPCPRCVTAQDRRENEARLLAAPTKGRRR